MLTHLFKHRVGNLRNTFQKEKLMKAKIKKTQSYCHDGNQTLRAVGLVLVFNGNGFSNSEGAMPFIPIEHIINGNKTLTLYHKRTAGNVSLLPVQQSGISTSTVIHHQFSVKSSLFFIWKSCIVQNILWKSKSIAYCVCLWTCCFLTAE